MEIFGAAGAVNFFSTCVYSHKVASLARSGNACFNLAQSACDNAPVVTVVTITLLDGWDAAKAVEGTNENSTPSRATKVASRILPNEP